MRVSLNNYRRMHQKLRRPIHEGIDEILSLDTDTELFDYQQKNERRIGRLLDKGYPIGTSSGTAALQFSLIAAGVKQGDEVITTPHTYIATALAISGIGARPVFVDIREDTMLIDPDGVEQAITSRTKAILPVHLYGQMTNMPALRRIARRHKLVIIEDACQAHGAHYKGKGPGSLSDAACYSFYPNKTAGGISNGGMILTRRRAIRKVAEQLRDPESGSEHLLRLARTPGYLDWDQMVLIREKLRHMGDWIKRRRTIARHYRQSLGDLPLVLPTEEKDAYHTYRDFVIRTPKRDKLQKHLKRASVQTAIRYITPVHLSPTYRPLGHKKGDFPTAEKACKEVLSLPINPFMEEQEIRYVTHKVRSFFKR